MTNQIHGVVREALSPRALAQVVYAEATTDVVKNVRDSILEKMSENDESLTMGLTAAIAILFDYKAEMWLSAARIIAQNSGEK